MLNQQIIVDTQAHLAERRANIVNISFGNPVERQFSFLQIRNGAPQQALKTWLEEALGNNIRLPALYAIDVDDQDTTTRLRDSFNSAQKNRNRGYALPRLNNPVTDSRVLYLGSSRSIRQRLKQHLWQAPVGTYALNMNRWVPQIAGNVTVRVQSILSELNSDALQDIEDAVWRSLRPVFGKAGGR